MKMLLSTLTFLILTTALYAQNNPSSSDYERKTIYEYGSRFILDGTKLKSKELQDNLFRFEPSKIEYIQSKRNGRTAGFLIITTLACYATAITQLDKKPGLAAGFAITGFTANIVALPFTTKARKQLQKSIWLFN
ncbi:MAG: hypothetical protein ABW036_10495, partial [Flavitalea sp.]